MAKKIKPKGKTRGGSAPGQAGMMAQFQKMQDDMKQAQSQLEDEITEVSVGGGAITVTITGHQRVKAININQELIDLEDEDWLIDLQELLVLAVNQAVEQSQAMAADRMEGITGGLGDMLPGGLGGLGGLLG